MNMSPFVSICECVCVCVCVLVHTSDALWFVFLLALCYDITRNKTWKMAHVWGQHIGFVLFLWRLNIMWPESASDTYGTMHNAQVTVVLSVEGDTSSTVYLGPGLQHELCIIALCRQEVGIEMSSQVLSIPSRRLTQAGVGLLSLVCPTWVDLSTLWSQGVS